MLARYACALSAALVYSIGYGANGAAAQSKPTLVFTAIPDQDETRLVQRFTAAGKYLEGKLGVPVKYLPVKSYAASVTAFKNNQVQLAWFGGLSGVQARLAVPGSQAIAQGAEDVQFKSHFIANTATGINPIAKLDDTIKGNLAYTVDKGGFVTAVTTAAIAALQGPAQSCAAHQ